MGHKRVQQERNLVAKHARKFNKSHVMIDRKRAMKAGKVKHKGVQHD